MPSPTAPDHPAAPAGAGAAGRVGQLPVVAAPLDAAAYLGVARSLLAAARPGALFPDAGPIERWLALLAAPAPSGRPRRLWVHPASGLPSRRSLAQLTRLRAAALAAHATPGFPRRMAAGRGWLMKALLAADLPPLEAATARLVGPAGRGHRLVVVYERLDAASGCPVRYTIQLEQRAGRRVELHRGDLAAVSEGFALALAGACAGSAEAALGALAGLDGLIVTEVVRGQLGPLTTALGGEGPFREAVVRGGGVLALLVERAGVAVRADHDGDPWAPIDRSAGAAALRASRRYHLARERRLICTPAEEAAVRSVAVATGVPLLIRSR